MGEIIDITDQIEAQPKTVKADAIAAEVDEHAKYREHFFVIRKRGAQCQRIRLTT